MSDLRQHISIIYKFVWWCSSRPCRGAGLPFSVVVVNLGLFIFSCEKHALYDFPRLGFWCRGGFVCMCLLHFCIIVVMLILLWV